MTACQQYRSAFATDSELHQCVQSSSSRQSVSIANHWRATLHSSHANDWRHADITKFAIIFIWRHSLPIIIIMIIIIYRFLERHKSLGYRGASSSPFTSVALRCCCPTWYASVIAIWLLQSSDLDIWFLTSTAYRDIITYSRNLNAFFLYFLVYYILTHDLHLRPLSCAMYKFSISGIQ